MRIMLCGPSGIGKTTIAEQISKDFGISYISGSVSDLIPETKVLKHAEMLSRSNNTLIKEDYQVVNLRNRLFKDLNNFVTDRSYVDSAAYFLYKQSTKIPTCEIEQFITLCRMLLTQQCDLLVFLSLLPEDVNNWLVEDNDKRVVNTYYQVQISSIMSDILRYMGLCVDYTTHHLSTTWFGKTLDLNRPVSVGTISTPTGTTTVLEIPDLDKEHRLKVLNHFIRKSIHV